MKKSKSSSTGTGVRESNAWLPYAVVLFLTTFMVFGNSIRNGYTFDDKPFIAKNYIVQQGWSGIPLLLKTDFWAGYVNASSANPSYRPLPLITLAIEYQLFGLNPAVNHFFNVLFYALTIVTLFMLLNIFFKGKRLWLSVAVAVLFCVHPIHTEVVANVKGRDDLLALLNALVSLLLLFKYTQSGKKGFLFTSVVFFFLALISKAHILAFVAVIPLSLYFFTTLPWRKTIQYSLLYLATALVFLLIQYRIIGSVTEFRTDYIDNPILAASSSAEGIATRINVLGLYVQKLIVPYPLSCDYSYAVIKPVGFGHPMVYIWLLVYASLIYFAWKGFKSKAVWSYAILLFLIALAPVSNLFVTYVVAFAERAMYVPSLGLILLAVVSLDYAITQMRDKWKWTSSQVKNIQWIGMALLLLVLAVQSIARNPDWKNDAVLFATDVRTHPESLRLNILYAQQLISQYSVQKPMPVTPDLLEAKKALEVVLEKEPEMAKALMLTGSIAKLTGDYLAAEDYYKRALATDENNPSVYFNLGVMADLKQDYATAKSMYLKSLELFPNYGSALANLGVIYGRENNLDLAIETFTRSAQLEPMDETVYNNLSMAYQLKGDKIQSDFYKLKANEVAQANAQKK